MSSKKKFLKPAFTIQQQVGLLKDRRLIIDNLDFVEKCLSTVSYYRLSGYCKIFQDCDHKFKPNVKFKQIWELYTFDQELRLLVTKAIEKIEVAFRASMSNFMSIELGPHWYLDPSLFKSYDFHDKLMQQISKICKDRKEVFLNHYYQNYLEAFPPSWMIFECISFGTISLMFRDLKSMRYKKEVAKIFGYPPTLIESWIEPLCYTRNLCAHHSRLWNRWFILDPQIPNNRALFKQFAKRIQRKFYLQALVIILLLEQICPDYNWQKELFALLEKYPNIPKQNMGFGKHWQDDPLWKLHMMELRPQHAETMA